MLFFIFSKREVSIIKTIVYEHDPDAILVITDVNEAIGYGFKKRGSRTDARGNGVLMNDERRERP